MAGDPVTCEERVASSQPEPPTYLTWSGVWMYVNTAGQRPSAGTVQVHASDVNFHVASLSHMYQTYTRIREAGIRLYQNALKDIEQGVHMIRMVVFVPSLNLLWVVYVFSNIHTLKHHFFQ